LHVAITRARHRVHLLTERGRESVFLAEMAGAAPVRATPPPGPRPRAAARPERGSATVEARVGLTLTANGGFDGTIEALDADGVQVRLVAGGSLLVRYGETVTVYGKAATLVARPELSADVEQAEEALRAWRLERCRRDKVSAFIVLNDRHLRAIATKGPTTLAELRAVDGIGPTKLELYGEEILDVLASVGERDSGV